MQNIRCAKSATESSEKSISNGMKDSNLIEFAEHIPECKQNDPVCFKGSNLILANKESDFLMSKKTFEITKSNDCYLTNYANEKDIMDRPEFNENLNFNIMNYNYNNNNNQENYFEESCKSDSDIYQKSLGGKSISNYFDTGKKHFITDTLCIIENEFDEYNNERFYRKNNSNEADKISDDMQIHNIIFTERNDKKEVNEDSDFFKNDCFFTKNTSTQENNLNFSNKITHTLSDQDLKEEGIKYDSNLKSGKSNSKSNKKDKSYKDRDLILKDIEKIYLLINNLFLREISSYDKFILIYKIGNILKRDNNVHKFLILEIIEKYRERKKVAKNAYTDRDLKNDYKNFKEDIEILYDNFSDSKLNFPAEEFIRRKKKFVAKIIKFFTKFLKRNKLIIVKNAN